MRMIDCFSPAMIGTLEFTQTIRQGENPDYETVSISIRRELSEHAREYLTGGYSEEQYEMAKFGAIAFIDEAILSTSWEQKRQWRENLLQMEHFKTVKAGELFYERLNSLSPVNPAERDIREVYYYCLALGFRGKYFNPDDRARLEGIKRDNLELLVGEGRIPGKGYGEALFPEGYIETRSGGSIFTGMNLKGFYYGIPVLVLLVLFFLFQSRIIEMANRLVTLI